jgi:hypothetical protein
VGPVLISDAAEAARLLGEPPLSSLDPALQAALYLALGRVIISWDGYHDEAVSPMEQTDNLVPLSARIRPEVSAGLAEALFALFRIAGHDPDLDRAIAAMEAALAGTWRPYPSRTDRSLVLAVMLGARFERSGDATDLDRVLTLIAPGLYTRLTSARHADDQGGVADCYRAALATAEWLVRAERDNPEWQRDLDFVRSLLEGQTSTGDT